ncbi:11519_t:CDS:2, partial [Acaulospora morrowiae]
PGRLDKSLFCNMPNYNERLEILKALSRKVDLGEDVNLSFYAEKCQGYSGADLQSLLYNAHLEAIHETIDAEKSSEKRTTISEDIELRFTSFNMNSSKKATTFTAAEKTQIIKRLALVKKASLPKKVVKVKGGQDNVQTKSKAVINDVHMQKSLKITRPSTTPEEYLRLDAIYNEFITGRNGQMPSGISSHEIGQRTTLC